MSLVSPVLGRHGVIVWDTVGHFLRPKFETLVSAKDTVSCFISDQSLILNKVSDFGRRLKFKTLVSGKDKVTQWTWCSDCINLANYMQT